MKEVHFQAWGHNGRCFSNANVSKPPKSAWLKIEWFFQTNVPVHSTKSSPTYRLWVSPSPQKSAREFQTSAPNWPRQDDVSFAKWKPHFSKRPLAWWETFSFLWPAKIQFKNWTVCVKLESFLKVLSEMQNQFFTQKTLHVKNTKSKFKLKFKVFRKLVLLCIRMCFPFHMLKNTFPMQSILWWPRLRRYYAAIHKVDWPFFFCFHLHIWRVTLIATACPLVRCTPP